MKNGKIPNFQIRIFFILILFLFVSCSSKKSSVSTIPVLKISEAHLSVPGGNIWYKVSGSGKGIPLVLLHGGPGMSSFYLKPFEQLGNERQVIRYDQLGGGKSDVITDTAMFTVDHFVKELELLRIHLGISKWHILGHSWGTLLAFEYYRAYPERVASLTLGSMCIDVPGWEKSTRHLLTTLPDSSQKAVQKAESTGNYIDPAYGNAINQFYSLYVFRKPVKADLDSMNATFNIGMYTYMWGPSEFSVTGTLKANKSLPYLKGIRVPTLFTVGEFDEIDPEIVKDWAGKVPGAIFIVFPGSSHMTPWDAGDESIKVERAFLNSADLPD